MRKGHDPDRTADNRKRKCERDNECYHVISRPMLFCNVHKEKQLDENLNRSQDKDDRHQGDQTSHMIQASDERDDRQYKG